MERVVEIVQQKTGLGKCNVNPGTELLPPEPCNIGIPCPISEAPGSGFGGRSGVEEGGQFPLSDLFCGQSISIHLTLMFTFAEGTFGDWTETEGNFINHLRSDRSENAK